jgi:hypothetical protein
MEVDVSSNKAKPIMIKYTTEALRSGARYSNLSVNTFLNEIRNEFNNEESRNVFNNEEVRISSFRNLVWRSIDEVNKNTLDIDFRDGF